MAEASKPRIAWQSVDCEPGRVKMVLLQLKKDGTVVLQISSWLALGQGKGKGKEKVLVLIRFFLT